MNIVYQRKHINVYKMGNEYIIHNTHKPWRDDTDPNNGRKKGHTHIEHKNTAIWLCDIAAYKRLPKTNCMYFYESLIRLSDDEVYTKKLNELLNHLIEKKKNPQLYRNRTYK